MELRTPYEHLVPPLATPEYEALKASIEADRAVHDPIWVDEQNSILDGHHRHRAVGELRGEQEILINLPTRVRTGLSEPEKKAFVLASNMRRRNLSPEQKEELRETQIAVAKELRAVGKSQADIGLALGVTQQAVSLWLTPNTSPCNGRIDNRQKLTAEERSEIHERVKAGESQNQIKADYGISQQHVSRVHVAEAKKHKAVGRPIPIKPGTYRCVVIDPPWEMEKIERDLYPNQIGFDYHTMTEAELADPNCPKWRGCPPQLIAADDCHLYLWTTHKHLPAALRLAEAWGFRYECLLTWVKNVGFTPFSWMRSTEHVLFCRKGNLKLLKLGLRLDFRAKVREHSRKPDEFYELVRQASSGPRIDQFSREPHAGFDQWGDQTQLFANPLRPDCLQHSEELTR